MDIKLTLAIVIGKLIVIATKLLGSGATAAPGLYALKIDPDLVKKLAKKLQYGSIVISGTNGKTTTSRLTADILSTKFKIIHNRQGSNLLRGIASTLISHTSFPAKISSNLGIWEVDEATLPQAIEHTNPKTIALLDLFRDQLDRYGEVDTVRARWQKVLTQLPTSTTLILNADDPGVSYLANSFSGKVRYFGVEDKKLDLVEISNVADIRNCLNCGANLNYSALLTAHMGHYLCPNCTFKRPTPQVLASNLKFNSDFSTECEFTVHSSKFKVKYQLPGLYNVYNVLAATAICDSQNIDQAKIAEKIESFPAAFGRFQSIKIGSKQILIFLIKNPAGANEVIRTIAKLERINLLTVLNDNIADGRDVSWIWDTNWEVLQRRIKSVNVSGTRAWDLATRLKYADIKLSKNNVYENINYSVEQSISKLNNNDTLIILPTYTAMLEVQKFLKKGGARSWHQE